MVIQTDVFNEEWEVHALLNERPSAICCQMKGEMMPWESGNLLLFLLGK